MRRFALCMLVAACSPPPNAASTPPPSPANEDAGLPPIDAAATPEGPPLPEPLASFVQGRPLHRESLEIEKIGRRPGKWIVFFGSPEQVTAVWALSRDASQKPARCYFPAGVTVKEARVRRTSAMALLETRAVFGQPAGLRGLWTSTACDEPPWVEQALNLDMMKIDSLAALDAPRGGPREITSRKKREHAVVEWIDKLETFRSAWSDSVPSYRRWQEWFHERADVKAEERSAIHARIHAEKALLHCDETDTCFTPSILFAFGADATRLSRVEFDPVAEPVQGEPANGDATALSEALKGTPEEHATWQTTWRLNNVTFGVRFSGVVTIDAAGPDGIRTMQLLPQTADDYAASPLSGSRWLTFGSAANERTSLVFNVQFPLAQHPWQHFDPDSSLRAISASSLQEAKARAGEQGTDRKLSLCALARAVQSKPEGTKVLVGNAPLPYANAVPVEAAAQKAWLAKLVRTCADYACSRGICRPKTASFPAVDVIDDKGKVSVRTVLFPSGYDE